MTLQELRQEIQNLVGDTNLSTTSIDRWVNQAITKVASRGAFPFSAATKETDTTTASTTEYTLPTDFKRMISVKLAGSASEAETDADELEYIRYEDKDISGATGYYLNPTNSKYGILPTPDTSSLPIYLKYFKLPATLSATTDEPPFPSNYHEICIYFALKKYWEMSDDFGKAVYYDREFENMVDQMKTDLMNRAVGQRPRMMDIREFAGSGQDQWIKTG